MLITQHERSQCSFRAPIDGIVSFSNLTLSEMVSRISSIHAKCWLIVVKVGSVNFLKCASGEVAPKPDACFFVIHCADEPKK